MPKLNDILNGMYQGLNDRYQRLKGSEGKIAIAGLLVVALAGTPGCAVDGTPVNRENTRGPPVKYAEGNGIKEVRLNIENNSVVYKEVRRYFREGNPIIHNQMDVIPKGQSGTYYIFQDFDNPKDHNRRDLSSILPDRGRRCDIPPKDKRQKPGQNVLDRVVKVYPTFTREEYLNPPVLDTSSGEWTNKIDTGTIEGLITQNVFDGANSLYNSLREKIWEQLIAECEAKLEKASSFLKPK